MLKHKEAGLAFTDDVAVKGDTDAAVQADVAAPKVQVESEAAEGQQEVQVTAASNPVVEPTEGTKREKPSDEVEVDADSAAETAAAVRLKPS